MPRTAFLLVAIGGAFGVAVRWALTGLITSSGSLLDVGVLVANVAGCLILGIALSAARARPHQATLLRAGVGTGFCGGLTTFSTLTVRLAGLLEEGSYAQAATELAVSVALGALAIVVGRSLGRRFVADTP